MRLFFALPLPPEATERLRPIVEAVRAPGLSVGKPEQLHFTLAFLGEQPEEAVARASEAAEPLRQRTAFDLAIGGAGAFPGPRRPRVLWLGVTEGAEALAAAADQLSAGLRAQGFELEDRPYKPHLTLARVKPGGERAASRALAAIPPGELVRIPAKEIRLMQSVLGAGGPRHQTLRSFGLSGA